MTKAKFKPYVKLPGDTRPGQAVTLFARHDTPTLPILNAVNDLWREIQVNHPGTPNVNIVLQASEYSHGHFAPGSWQGVAQHELMLSTISLSMSTNSGAVIKTVSTLLHEAAHAFAHEKGIQDTSRGGRYHNSDFAQLATAFGCEVQKDKEVGHRTDGITSMARVRYDAQISALMAAVTTYRKSSLIDWGALLGGMSGGHRGPVARKPRKTYGSETLTIMCECEGRKFRVARDLYQNSTIHCDLCDTDCTE